MSAFSFTPVFIRYLPGRSETPFCLRELNVWSSFMLTCCFCLHLLHTFHGQTSVFGFDSGVDSLWFIKVRVWTMGTQRYVMPGHHFGEDSHHSTSNVTVVTRLCYIFIFRRPAKSDAKIKVKCVWCYWESTFPTPHSSPMCFTSNHKQTCDNNPIKVLLLTSSAHSVKQLYLPMYRAPHPRSVSAVAGLSGMQQ